MAVTEKPKTTLGPLGSGVLFLAVAGIWVGLDQWVKLLLGSNDQGITLGLLPGGLMRLEIVHNTGAAWGIFAGNSWALGLFSLGVCLVLAVYYFVTIKTVNLFETIGIGLVVGGGIGNAIDRFSQGYVLDYLATNFMDFPVFNIADIGVTCGIGIFLLGLIWRWIKTSKPSPREGNS